MNFKKVLTGFAAASLAVSSLSVSLFASTSIEAKPEGTETVLAKADLSDAIKEFGATWQNGSWVKIEDVKKYADEENVYVKVSMSNIGTSDGNTLEEMLTWGYANYSWASLIKWYNNDTADETANFEVNFVAAAGSTSDNAVAYAPISDFAFTQWNEIAGNIQATFFSSVTLEAIELVKIEEEEESTPSEGEDPDEPVDIELPEGYEQIGETISGEHTFAAPSWNPESEDADSTFNYIDASLFTSEEDLIIVSVSTDAGAYPTAWQIALCAAYENQSKWNDYTEKEPENKLFIQAKVSDVMAAADDGIDSLDKLNGVNVKLWGSEIGHKIKYSITLAKKTEGEDEGETTITLPVEETELLSDWSVAIRLDKGENEEYLKLFENVKKGDIITVNYKNANGGQLQFKDSDWASLSGNSQSGTPWNEEQTEFGFELKDGDGKLQYVIDENDVAKLKEGGLIIGGKNVTVTSVTLTIKSSGSTGGNNDNDEDNDNNKPGYIPGDSGSTSDGSTSGGSTSTPSDTTAEAETTASTEATAAPVEDTTADNKPAEDTTDNGDDSSSAPPQIVPQATEEQAPAATDAVNGDSNANNADKNQNTGAALALIPAIAAAAGVVISKKRK